MTPMTLSSSWGYETTVVPAFTMPAFSCAMASGVSPSKSVWSSPIRTITHASGASMMFVESRRPPRPTSQTTMSHPLRAKYSKATAVMSSNSVGCSPISSAMASACRRTNSVTSSKSSEEMLAPSTRMRSSNWMMYGLVNSPVRYPASCSTLAMYAQVEPLPFVPATCTNFNLSWGRPMRSSSSTVRSRPIRTCCQRGSLI